MKKTSLRRDVIEEAAQRLKQAGLLEVLVDEQRGYESWRVSEAGHWLEPAKERTRRRSGSGAVPDRPQIYRVTLAAVGRLFYVGKVGGQGNSGPRRLVGSHRRRRSLTGLLCQKPIDG